MPPTAAWAEAIGDSLLTYLCGAMGLGTWHVVGAMNTYRPDERWKDDVDAI